MVVVMHGVMVILLHSVGNSNSNGDNTDMRVNSAPFLPPWCPCPCTHTEAGSPNAADGHSGMNESALAAQAHNKH